MPTSPALPSEYPGCVHLHSGKVRELYRIEAGDHAGRLLMVATDRISAFDYVLDTPIPDKGVILTRMSTWWGEQLGDLAPNHVVSTDVPEAVRDRAVICEPLDMVKVECVARGYLTGSGLADYRRTGTVNRIALPDGLTDGSALADPVFTPTTKAEVGDHDEPMTYADVEAEVGESLAAELRDLTLAVYARGRDLARRVGIILADTKIEVGRRLDGTLVLADELLTPDSSRYWPADLWQPGRAQPSYDKQIVRDWLTSSASGWDRESGEPPPPLPDEIVARTRERYADALRLLTGERV